MSHGVHAVQHEAEHKIQHDSGHGGHDSGAPRELLDKRNKKVALLIAVLALGLAFSETLGKSAQTSAISYNVEASNLWAFFQAKTIRSTVLETMAQWLRIFRIGTEGGEKAGEATKGAVNKQIDSYEKTIKRYGSEKMDPPKRKAVDLNPPYGEGREELMKRAIAAEAKRDTALERYHHYEVASAAFQIGIVLASATVITGMVLLSYIAGALGLIGVAFMGIGLFAPHAVHLF